MSHHSELLRALTYLDQGEGGVNIECLGLYRMSWAILVIWHDSSASQPGRRANRCVDACLSKSQMRRAKDINLRKPNHEACMPHPSGRREHYRGSVESCISSIRVGGANPIDQSHAACPGIAVARRLQAATLGRLSARHAWRSRRKGRERMPAPEPLRRGHARSSQAPLRRYSFGGLHARHPWRSREATRRRMPARERVRPGLKVTSRSLPGQGPRGRPAFQIEPQSHRVMRGAPPQLPFSLGPQGKGCPGAGMKLP